MKYWRLNKSYIAFVFIYSKTHSRIQLFVAKFANLEVTCF